MTLSDGSTISVEEQVLVGVTRRLNADWRLMYRVFCIMVWACRGRGDTTAASRDEDLCRIPNPQLSAALLGGSIALFQPLSLGNKKTSRENFR